MRIMTLSVYWGTYMKIEEIVKILGATVHHIPDSYDKAITRAGASDLLSDVLAYISEDILFITGLVNQQVIRTAALMDITAIVFTRGKEPTEEMIEEAIKNNIVILSTPLKTFTTSGVLYRAGLRGIES